MIVHIDSERMKEQFRNLGVENPGALFNLPEVVKLNSQFEINELSAQNFFSQLLTLAKLDNVNIEAIKAAWNSLVLEIPQEKIDMLMDLRRQGYKVYALSNTNITHIEYLDTLCRQACPELEGLRDLFDEVFYSYEIRVRKPDEAFFTHACQSAKVRAEESLFIDDRKENTDAAKKLGINTLLTAPNIFDSTQITKEYRVLHEARQERFISLSSF